MALLNYSTKIDAWQTVSEIQQLLAKAGASHFSIKNNGAEPAAVSFSIMLNDQPLNFLLPCNVAGIKNHLKSPDVKKILRGDQLNLDKQSMRVGWRIIKDWIEAQTALINIEMVTIEEVFMPYLVINAEGQTLAQKMLRGDGMKLLNF